MSDNKLTIRAKQKNTLSKQQQQFNKLISEIEALKAKKQELTGHFQNAKSIFAEKLLPLVEQARDLNLQLIFGLDHGFQKFKIAKKYKDAVSYHIEEILDTIIPILEETGEDTTTLKEIYERHAEINYDEQQQGLNDASADLFESIFGVKIDPNKMEDEDYLEDMQKEFNEKMGFKERKKTKKQLEKEAKQKEAQDQLNKDLKTVYTDLAKQLHPDLEQDETLREAKNELMKRVTEAYSNTDLYELLQIQLEVEQLDPDKLSNVSDDLMNSYIEVLKKQVAELRASINDEFKNTPVYEMMFDSKDRFTETKLKAQVKELKSNIKMNKELIEQTKSKEQFLNLAKNMYEEMQEEDDDDFFFNFFN